MMSDEWLKHRCLRIFLWWLVMLIALMTACSLICTCKTINNVISDDSTAVHRDSVRIIERVNWKDSVIYRYDTHTHDSIIVQYDCEGNTILREVYHETNNNNTEREVAEHSAEYEQMQHIIDSLTQSHYQQQTIQASEQKSWWTRVTEKFGAWLLASAVFIVVVAVLYAIWKVRNKNIFS